MTTRTLCHTFAAISLVIALSAAAATAESPTTRPAATQPATEAFASALDEVLVTATRGELVAFQAPYATYSLKLSRFNNNRLYRTAVQALGDVPGIMVQKTGHGQGSPYLRGFTGFRTLMLIDGIRLNNSIFRDGPNQYWNLIDPLVIDRIEVVKGPSSALYGSDAIGGTANALLRRPEFSDQGFQWHRQVFYRAASATREQVGRGEINLSTGSRMAVMLGGTFQHFGNVEGGQFVGRQRGTGYDVGSGDFRLELRPTDNSLFTLAHYSLYQNDASRTHKTTDGISWKGTTVGNERERVLDQLMKLTYLRFRVTDLDGPIQEVNAFVSWQHMEERRHRVKSNFSSDDQGVDVDTFGGGLQFISRGGPMEWTYGFEWYHDSVDSFATKYNADGSLKRREIQGPVGDDATYDLVGVYVQNRWEIGEQADVILGGRYTYARAEANRVKDPDTGELIAINDDWNALVGSARLNVYPDRQRRWNVFGGVSQGFRAPNLSDLSRLDSARSDEIETPSPGLDPEYFLTYEVGVKARYDQFAMQAAYFYTDVKDMIVRAPTGAIVDGDSEVTKRNAGEGYLHGVELEASYRFHSQWTAFGSFACTQGKVKQFPTSDPTAVLEPVSRLMPATGKLGLRWDHPDGKLWAEAICTIAGKANELSTRDLRDTQRIPPGGTPGYVVFDLRGGWRVNDSLDLFGAIENVTNRDYRIHGSGVNEPGINFRLGVKVRF